MGQGTRRHFTPAFKAKTVKRVTEGGHPLSQVAADLGIHASLLCRWRRRAVQRLGHGESLRPQGVKKPQRY